MKKITARLKELGIELPEPKSPVANYLGSKRSGDLLFVSARVSDLRGEVGADVTTERAREAARATVIDILAIIKRDIEDLDQIVGVEKVLGFVRSAPDFTEQPQVIDGASDLLVDIWGDAGRHARTTTGVAQLPFGASVQIEMILRLIQ
ncbi:MAG: RidA family protein [Candidatus Zixiibacteriota bacterium]